MKKGATLKNNYRANWPIQAKKKKVETKSTTEKKVQCATDLEKLVARHMREGV